MDALPLFLGIPTLARGVPMALRPARNRSIANARWRQRLEELEGGAPESYFEERRSLIAYPPCRTDRRTRVVGILSVFIGLALIALSFRH
ncbi:hypothetical protein WBP07_08380 [Novosphingobium sp. BL-8A]|uniref:hypothetical protein n=1 Tax=Novosphingobium sp. BL-8A TaxID=3127639 RepID=UPI003757150D